MSSYLNVYYHDQEHDSYISLGSFSRSTEVYRLFNENGHTGIKHKIAPITINEIQDIIGSAQLDIDYNKKAIADIKAKTQTILGLANHTIQEKMEAVVENEESLPEYEESIDDLNYAYDYLVFLEDLIQHNIYAHKTKDGSTFKPDKDKLIYCGIDCDSPIDYHWD